MIMLRSPSPSDTSHAPTLLTYRSATGTPEEEAELALLEQWERQQNQRPQNLDALQEHLQRLNVAATPVLDQQLAEAAPPPTSGDLPQAQDKGVGPSSHSSPPVFDMADSDGSEGASPTQFQQPGPSGQSIGFGGSRPYPAASDSPSWLSQQAWQAAPGPSLEGRALPVGTQATRFYSDQAAASPPTPNAVDSPPQAAPPSPPPAGQQPPTPPKPPVTILPPQTPQQPTPPMDGKKDAPVASHEVEPSDTDTHVINGVYDLSPTARLVYNEAHKLGYKVQFMKKGSVAQMNNDPNAIATVRGGPVRVIYAETLPPPPATDFQPGTAVFHEAFHIIQTQYRKDPRLLSNDARRLIENVRYPEEDRRVGVSPADLEATRVQSIILKEVERKTGIRKPLLKEYGIHTLPPGTEMGRAGGDWRPEAEISKDTPPIAKKTKAEEKTRLEKTSK